MPATLFQEAFLGSQGRNLLEAFTFGFTCFTSFCDGYEEGQKGGGALPAAGYGIEVVWKKAEEKYAIIFGTVQDVWFELHQRGPQSSGANSKSVCPERII